MNSTISTVNITSEDTADYGEPVPHLVWIDMASSIARCLMVLISSINFYIYYGKYRNYLHSDAYRFPLDRTGTRMFSQPSAKSSSNEGNQEFVEMAKLRNRRPEPPF